MRIPRLLSSFRTLSFSAVCPSVLRAMTSVKRSRRHFFIYDEDTEEVLDSFSQISTTKYQLSQPSPSPNSFPVQLPFPTTMTTFAPTEDFDDDVQVQVTPYLRSGPVQNYEMDTTIPSLGLNQLLHLPYAPENNCETRQEKDTAGHLVQSSVHGAPLRPRVRVCGYTVDPHVHLPQTNSPLRRPNHLPLHATYTHTSLPRHRPRLNVIKPTQVAKRQKVELSPKSHARRQKRKYIWYRDSLPSFSSVMSVVMERTLSPNQYALLE